MYESFYGLKEKPFTLLPDPDYLYLSPKHQRALTLLEYGMMNQAGFSVICGDTGAGKTTLIRRLLSELGDDTKVGLITNTHHSFGELLNWVLMAFGLDGDGKSKAQMHQMFISFLIEQYADNKHTVLIVDEAQNMNADTLEELRMLSNINADKDQVLQVILAGQPALRETLRKPELMQFAQRIAVDYYLESLSCEETVAYVHHRLQVAGAEKPIFLDDACKVIYEYSGGTPRLINLLCDTALVYGFAEQNDVISAQLVHDVVREQHSNSIIPAFYTGYVNKGENDDKKPADEANQQERKTDKVIEVSEAAVEAESLAVSKPEEIVAELSQKSMHQNSAAMNGVEQAMHISHSQTSSPVEKTTLQSSSVESTKDESNVTPINAKMAETNTAHAIDEATDKVGSKEPPTLKVDKVIESKQDASSDAVAEGVDSDEAIDNSYKNNRTQIATEELEDVYPIVHIEEPPKKGVNIVLLALVGGMFVSSIIMMGAAWIMFGSNQQIDQNVERHTIDRQTQQDVVNRELKALQKERDAAIAVTRALERERDAAIKSAKAQEQIHAAERHAAEVLAAQERKAEKELQRARARTREAERAESKARARERKLQLETEKRKAELERQRQALFHKEQARLEVMQAETQRAKRLQAQQQQQRELSRVKEPEIVTKATPKAKEGFSGNACNSPAAKFLSTCKK